VKRAATVMLASWAAVTGPAQQGTAPQTPVFRAATDVVLVNVLVTRGRTPVIGLTAGDFDLRDNGVRQEVDVLALEGRSIDVTFVSGAVPSSQREQLERARASSEELRAMLRADDRLGVIVSGERVWQRPMRPVSEATGFGPRTGPALGSSLNDALVYALMRPVDPDRGHLVVAYTSGFESWSTLDAEWIREVARRADAVLHAVVPGPPPAAPTRGIDGMQSESGARFWASAALPPGVHAEWRATYDAIDDAVRATGGSLHHVSGDAGAFQRILDDYRHSYVLRYTPRGVDRGGWHEIDVSITRAGSFSIRARKGYGTQ
jgi:hypothetical protein